MWQISYINRGRELDIKCLWGVIMNGACHHMIMAGYFRSLQVVRDTWLHVLKAAGVAGWIREIYQLNTLTF